MPDPAVNLVFILVYRSILSIFIAVMLEYKANITRNTE